MNTVCGVKSRFESNNFYVRAKPTDRLSERSVKYLHSERMMQSEERNLRNSAGRVPKGQRQDKEYGRSVGTENVAERRATWTANGWTFSANRHWLKSPEGWRWPSPSQTRRNVISALSNARKTSIASKCSFFWQWKWTLKSEPASYRQINSILNVI